MRLLGRWVRTLSHSIPCPHPPAHHPPRQNHHQHLPQELPSKLPAAVLAVCLPCFGNRLACLLGPGGPGSAWFGCSSGWYGWSGWSRWSGWSAWSVGTIFFQEDLAETPLHGWRATQAPQSLPSPTLIAHFRHFVRKHCGCQAAAEGLLAKLANGRVDSFEKGQVARSSCLGTRDRVPTRVDTVDHALEPPASQPFGSNARVRIRVAELPQLARVVVDHETEIRRRADKFSPNEVPLG